MPIKVTDPKHPAYGKTTDRWLISPAATWLLNNCTVTAEFSGVVYALSESQYQQVKPIQFGSWVKILPTCGYPELRGEQGVVIDETGPARLVAIKGSTQFYVHERHMELA